MKKKILSKKKLYFSFIAAFVIVLASFFTYSLFTGIFSLATNSVGWDGVSVASSFSGGNGEVNNPYQISNAEEFMYFKELIEGDSFSTFQDSYYILTNDIDFSGNSITPIGFTNLGDERLFKGNFDGNGFTIRNFKIDTPSVVDEKKYYSLFSRIVDAEIYNLNLEDFNIKTSTDSSIISTLVGEIYTSVDSIEVDVNSSELDTSEKLVVTNDEVLSSIRNISINNFFVEVDGDNDNTNNLSVLSNYVSSNSLIKNISLKGTIKNNNSNICIVPDNVTNISNVLFDVIYSGNLLENKINDLYIVRDKIIYLNDVEISSTSLLSLFNENNEGEYSWIVEDDKYVLRRNISSIAEVATNSSMMFALSSRASNRVEVDSGLSQDGSTVYINDLEMDRNYYTGLNYVGDFSTNANFGTNMRRYNATNMVKVYVEYDGHDMYDSSIYGTVSIEEKTTNFVYYKYYIAEGGYLEFELIDNPYANRPNNKYFNGWVTDYEGAEIHHRAQDYVRTVRIPVTNTSNVIDITFHANWTEYGNTGFFSNVTSSINSFDTGMVVASGGRVYDRESTDGLYVYGGQLTGNLNTKTFPAGAVNKKGEDIGNKKCASNNYSNDYCKYYLPLESFYDSNGNLIEDVTFYELYKTLDKISGTYYYEMIDVILPIVEMPFPENKSVAGYFRKRTSSNSSNNNYYDASGNPTTSCSSRTPCYELMQYYDQYGNVNLSGKNDELYMLATRDTNILVLDGDANGTTFNYSKPFTLTGINNGKVAATNAQVRGNYSIKNNADLRVEYITLRSTITVPTTSTGNDLIPSKSNTTKGTIYGNWYNLKVGRGIVKNSSDKYTSTTVFSGGSTTFSGTRRTIVESGYYEFGISSNGTGNSTVNVTGIWGSDYDRVVNPNGNNLTIAHSILGAFNGTITSKDTSKPAITNIVKSGIIGGVGTNRNYYTSGMYVAARSTGYLDSSAEVIVEGGKVFNLIGGPSTADRNAKKDAIDIYIRIKGGEVDAIYGGAGRSPTYGSKVISVTGGRINYAVVGGSNGVEANSGDGKVNGNSYIYIGGNAVVGNETLSNSKLFGLASGDVFGHGNGKEGSSGVGPMRNSNILIDDGARILNNVYGGSNFGATGISGTATSHIIVNGGTIEGNIFGSGNNNGSGTENTRGSTTISSEIKIDVNGGTIGNIYGGANDEGVDCGNATINVYGGTIGIKDSSGILKSGTGNIYGGGYGHKTRSKEKVTINIGNGSTTPINILGNVYGGSALGSTNSSATDTASTSVTVNNGTIYGSVFGGAMGDSSYTPSVGGNISVVVNGGSIGNVYGGFDEKGSPSSSKTDTVEIRGGTIGTVFGGGNNTGQTTSKVTMYDGKVTGSLYGGSNKSGIVATSNVSILGGEIQQNVFGGGNNIGVTTTNVTFNVDENNKNNIPKAQNVFGGSNVQGTSDNSTVIINAGTIAGAVHGGNNAGGNVFNSSVTINDGKIGSVYGGGSLASNGPAKVVVNDGTISNVFGGGNSAGLYTVSGNATNKVLSRTPADSIVEINGGTIKKVFGGSNSTGDINTANVTVKNNGVFSEVSGINVTLNGYAQVMQDDKKNAYPQYKDMKSHGYYYIGIQNNTGREFKNLIVVLKYPNSVILNTFDVQNTDIIHSKIGNYSMISMVNNQELSMTPYAYQGFNFEIFSEVDKDDFYIEAEVIDISSSIFELYGGNNAGGNVNNTKINATKGQIYYVYGGGNSAPVTSTNVKLSNINGYDAFGGNNLSEMTSASYIEVSNSTFRNVYGGGNNANNGPSEVIVNSGTYTNVLGGGNAAESGNSNVTIKDGTIFNLYGGGNSAGLSNDSGECTSTLDIKGGIIGNIYGGSNKKGILKESNININIDQSKIPNGTPYIKKASLDVRVDKQAVTEEMIESNPDLYYGKSTLAKINVTVQNNTSEVISDWALLFNMPDIDIYSNTSSVNLAVDSTNGSLLRATSNTRNPNSTVLNPNGKYEFSFEVLSDASLNDFTCMGEVTNPEGIVILTSAFNINTVYGGGNQGNAEGHVESTNVNLNSGRIISAFGGGNAATIGKANVKVNGTVLSDLYGGGNMAAVNDSTDLDIDNATIFNNVYGGGNEGSVGNNTTVHITNTSVEGNAFGGGNGKAAIVYGDSNITIDGTSEIGTESSIAPNSGCVFASGNAADNGNAANPALGISKKEGNSNVNFVGGLVHGNVYGGAKMAVVYGEAKVNIGTSAVVERSLLENNIHISGSVFGGGESNASGSASYDGGAISVYKGINVNINGANYIKNKHDFIINGSIFGSGNASSSNGESKVDIKYLGTKDKPNQAISIQRSSDLTIESSVIELTGAKDRTNDDASARELFTFHHVDILKLINNSTLLLRNSANALKEFYSGVYSNGILTPATVEINDDTQSVTKNVDNRLYILTREHLQVYTTSGIVDTYGKVTGMTFFGMYTGGGSGYNYGVYDSEYSYGDKGDGSLVIAGGSYITGLQQENHDITKDGFYSNYLDEENFTDITTAYVIPTAPDPTGYMWSIGIPVDEYEVFLQASKLSSAGTSSLPLTNFNSGNTTFTVLGFDPSGLKEGINLMDYTEIPRVGETIEEANNTFGLVMKSETQEWTGRGVTKFTLDGYSGDTSYKTDNRNITPSLMFYLYHPKNIDLEDQELGYCTITLQSITPSENKLEFITRFITITVYLDAVKSEVIPGYDAAITYDKKYELPVSTSVNITNRSQFTAYFSLAEFYDSYDKVYGRDYSYSHVLTSGEAFPVNTMITMIDYGTNKSRPDYYYLKITPEIYEETIKNLNINHEASYPLSMFIKMDSVSPNNTYNDYEANKVYYNENNKIAVEEFVFIFDFKETNLTGQHLNIDILFELRNDDNYAYLQVQKNKASMFYSTYDTSNATLNQDFSENPNYLYYDIPFNFNYNTGIIYDIMGEQRVSVIDTNYESSRMGVNISFVDSDGENISSSLLVGTSIILDGKQYFSDGDGVFRIKLADKVSSIEKETQIVVNKDLPAGDYTLKYVLFASDDGLHNSSFENSVTKEFNVHVVSADNYISVESDDKEQIVDGETSLNLNGTKINKYSVKFSSKLSNQNFRIYIYKRSVESADSNEFSVVPFNSLFKNEYVATSDGGVYINVLNYRVNEFKLELNDELTSGTYKVSFEMYDNNQLIDQDIKYVIVKKNVE